MRSLTLNGFIRFQKINETIVCRSRSNKLFIHFYTKYKHNIYSIIFSYQKQTEQLYQRENMISTITYLKYYTVTFLKKNQLIFYWYNVYIIHESIIIYVLQSSS